MAAMDDWRAFHEKLSQCRACGLWEGRAHVVAGEGDPHARVLFVGEGPGRDEDATGRPFIGRSGQLLERMLNAIGLAREQVYITSVVKCRPPNNRTPAEEEALACLPYLRAQFALIRPAIIVCLGATAAKYLYDPQVRITRDRGKWLCKKGVWMLPTYHPAALLRNEGWKRDAWEDMQKLREKMLALGLDT